MLPVSGFRLTAGFGEYGLWSSSHTGQDFACAYGTPVHAVGDGRIIFAAYDGAYGNKIVIEHEDGTVTWYAHMDSFVRTSGTVQAGDVIGRVGMTGNTTGAHLHLEVRPHDGAPVAAAHLAARARHQDLTPSGPTRPPSELLDRRVAQQQPLDARATGSRSTRSPARRRPPRPPPCPSRSCRG